MIVLLLLLLLLPIPLYMHRHLPVCFASGMCSLRLLLLMCSLITGTLCCYSKHKRGGQFGTKIK